MNNKLIKSRNSFSVLPHENNPFLSIQRALDKALENFNTFFRLPMNVENLEGLTINPSIDIIEETDKIKVEAEVPGMGPEDLKISITNGSLVISGDKTISQKDEGKYYNSREIAYGRYQRWISLPDSVDVNKAKATFKKGMLWVEIPKKEGKTEERREIKVEDASQK